MQEESVEKPPEEKAKEIVGESKKKTPLFQKYINTTAFRIFISFLLFIILFGTTFFIAIRSRQAGEVSVENETVPEAEVIVPKDDESTKEPTVGEGCAVGGCSGQLCLKEGQESKLATTCVYRPIYACYNNATCEVQEDGECGWTQTDELTACLSQYQ